MKTSKKRKIGELIDGMAVFNTDVDKLENQIKKIKKKYGLLERDLMDEMADAKLSKASGVKASVTLQQKRHPRIADMGKFNKYVLKHRAFDLYQRRINSKAYFDRVENEEDVPGVKIFEHTKCQIKIKRS